MRLLIFIVLIMLNVFLTSCGQKSKNHSDIFWEANNKISAPLPKLENFKFAESTVQVGDEIIERRPQKIGHLKVNGGSLQIIKNLKGEVKIVSGRKNNIAPSEEFLNEAESLYLKKWDVLNQAKNKFVILWKAEQIFEPELVLDTASIEPSLFWQIDFLTQNGQEVKRLKLSTSLTIISMENLELHLQNATSIVFPLGPKQSDLTKQILTDLLGDGTLATSRVIISSQDGSEVKEPSGLFYYETDDIRFDHVQAFYYIQKTLKFAQNEWSLLLPFSLKVQLRTGFPEKTNAAFYYKGNIRLGDGDGVTYQFLPRDPSIVSHEVAHALIDAISGLGHEGETGSINEGFADYITATIWNQPLMGHTAYLKGPYKRSLINSKSLNEKNGGLYHDSQIISGMFWDLEKQLGDKKAQQLAIKTLARLGEYSEFYNIKPAVENAALELNMNANETLIVQNILAQRGF